MTTASDRIPTCKHCGNVCVASTVEEGGERFCCEGCAAVYQIMTDRAPQNADSYAELDNDGIAAQFVELKTDKTVRYRLYLPDIHCASCLWTLEQLNLLDTGIVHSEVDFVRRVIRVSINPAKTSLRKVAQLLASLAYPPHLSAESTATDTIEANRTATRKLYSRIAVAAFATANVMMMSIARYLAGSGGLEPALETVFIGLCIILSIPVLLFSAWPWLHAAYVSLQHKRIGLDIPVALGIVVLFTRSMVDIYNGTGEGFLDSFVGLVLFLLIGRLFQLKSFNAISFARTYKSFFPLSIRVRRDRNTTVIPIQEIVIGDKMEVRSSETIPCDGVVTSNSGYVDYSFVTGESSPVEVVNGSVVYAGGKVLGRGLNVVAIKKSSHGYLASLWENHQSATAENYYLKVSDTFGLYFTVATLVTALLGLIFWLPDTQMAFNVFTAVLIIACPCALTIAAPVTLGTAMSVLSSAGVYFKNVSVFVNLKKITTILFDKTGTLTQSGWRISYEGRPLTAMEESAISSIASQSTHPLSRAIAGNTQLTTVGEIEEVHGMGINGISNGIEVRIGRKEFVTQSPLTEKQQGTYVSVNGQVAGRYVVQHELRSGVNGMMGALRSRYSLKLISGDSTPDKQMFQEAFAENEMYFNQTPQEKQQFIERLQEDGDNVLMIGDGLNDAPAMMQASVGIAVSDSTATIVPACSMVIPAGKLQLLAQILSYTNSLHRIIVGLFVFTMAYNIVVISLALMGMITPILAAILMPLNSLLVIAVSVFGARLLGRRLKWA